MNNTSPPAAYSYRHIVTFEETNLMGNVYYVRHLAWQGRCREMFLKTHAPDVLDEFDRGLRLATLRVSCEYFDELHAFDEVEIRMTLAFERGHRIGLGFEYLVERSSVRAAEGFQEVGCLRLTPTGLTACEVPSALRAALDPFRR